MDKPYLTTLAREFRAGEGSFLLQSRIDMYWDKDAFRRLTEAMRACCKDYQYSQEQRERDLKEQEQLTEEQMHTTSKRTRTIRCFHEGWPRDFGISQCLCVIILPTPLGNKPLLASLNISLTPTHAWML